MGWIQQVFDSDTTRDALSAYAGPIPRFVVPILLSPNYFQPSIQNLMVWKNKVPGD